MKLNGIAFYIEKEGKVSNGFLLLFFSFFSEKKKRKRKSKFSFFFWSDMEVSLATKD